MTHLDAHQGKLDGGALPSPDNASAMRDGCLVPVTRFDSWVVWLRELRKQPSEANGFRPSPAEK
jgi:hypothetical protein